MTKNRNLFILIVVLFTLGFIGVERLISRLPDGPRDIVSFASLLVAIWVATDVIVGIIYKLAGVTKNIHIKFFRKSSQLPRLTHQQAEVVNSFWIWAMATFVTTNIIVGVLLARQQWKSILITSGIFFLLILLAYINYRGKIMGHTKEEIFK